VREDALGDRLVVHERPAARAAIAEHAAARAVPLDFRVLARDISADDPQIALAPAADAKDRLVDRHDTPPRGVVDLQPGRCAHHAVLRHHAGFAFSKPIWTSMPV
jgi:hypothetical protein